MSAAREPGEETLARAFRRWGAEPRSCELLGGTSCRVYALPRADADLVLRLTPKEPGRTRQTRNELHWLEHLARGGAAVCAPVPSLRGRPFEVLREGLGRAYLATAFQRARGASVGPLLGETWTPALFELCGRTLGEIHALSKSLRPRLGVRRYAWSGPGLVRLARRVLPAAERGALGRIERYCRRLSRLPRGRDDFGLIHGDFHQGNYRLDGHRLQVFDFGGCSYCWFAFDIAISVYTSLLERVHRGEGDLERHARDYLVPFLRGYERANRLAPVWIGLLPDFLELFNLSIFVSFFRSPSVRPHPRLAEFVGRHARGGEPCLDLERLDEEARRSTAPPPAGAAAS